MTELLSQTLTAFTIGLLGSGHCLAMCGGIMGALSMRSLAARGQAAVLDQGALVSASRIQVSAGGAEGVGPNANVHDGSLLSQLLLYSAGRLLSYAILGMALGLLGAVLVTAMEPARIVLRGLAGGLLIAMGLYLAGLWHGILVLERFGHRIWQRVGPGLRRGQGGTMLLGMSWGLLPCGLVYGTLAWAASAADPLLAGWLMLGK
jgi:sulfite exporter TauE/SafE